MRALRPLLICLLLAILSAQGAVAAAVLPHMQALMQPAMQPLVQGRLQDHVVAMRAMRAMPATPSMPPMASMPMQTIPATPCHHADGDHASVQPSGSATRCHGAQDHGRHDHARCGACPACCAGLALAPAPGLSPVGAGPSYVAIPFRAGHVTSADPVLPERPPRTSLV